MTRERSRAGILEEKLWQAWDARFRSEFNGDSLQLIWRSIHDSYYDEFQGHVDAYASDESAARSAVAADPPTP